VSALHVVTPAEDLKATSSLVRRLVQPNRDPAKRRICEWLSEIGDQHLLQFGLTADDIAILRSEHAFLSEAGRVPGTSVKDRPMHHSRLCALLIDCKTADVDDAAHFWAAALGRPVDLEHPMSRGNYRMLETPPDEPIVEIQRVEHESRVHIDIETDDIPAEVRRLEKLGATVVQRLERWVVMQAPTGQRFCVVRIQRPGFPRNANRWD
jgi:predicted enzyme related to lactoylglutathione lyase